MATRLALRRDKTVNWTEANPVLAMGEPGYDEDNNDFKIGDGLTAWLDLPTIAMEGPRGPQGATGDVTPAAEQAVVDAQAASALAQEAATNAASTAAAIPATNDPIVAALIPASSGSATSAALNATFVAKPTTRVAVAPLTAPNATSTLGAALDKTMRTIMKLPFPTTRWRLKMRNRNLRSATLPGGASTVTGVSAGVPVRATTTSSGGRWVGNCATDLNVLTADPVTIPTDGSWAYSPWFEDAGQQFETGVEKVLSLGITAPTGGMIAAGNSYQWASVTGSANVSVASMGSSVTVGPNVSYLDVAVEYEFARAIKVLLCVGDSNTLTYVPGYPPGTPAGATGALPYESWPTLAGAMAGFAVINLGVGSATTGNFEPNSADYMPQVWDRLPAGVEIDAVIFSLGTNDLGSPLSLWLPQLLSLDSYARTTLDVGDVWWTTITPRCYPDGTYTGSGQATAGYLSAGIASGVTSFQSTTSPATGLLTLGYGMNMEDVTVSTITGSGPYTVTLSAATVNPHYAGERWGQSLERLRTYKNALLRGIPDGINGIFDFEKATEAYPGAYMMDPQYAGPDWLHSQRGAATVKANIVVGSGVQPLLS